MLADIDLVDDTSSLYTVRCACPAKNATSQLYTTAGRSSSAILVSRLEWRTVSNAFEKSREMTTTNGLDCSRLVTVCRRLTMAAVVEPEGRKAYWSENERLGEVLEKPGIGRSGQRHAPSFWSVLV